MQRRTHNSTLNHFSHSTNCDSVICDVHQSHIHLSLTIYPILPTITVSLVMYNGTSLYRTKSLNPLSVTLHSSNTICNVQCCMCISIKQFLTYHAATDIFQNNSRLENVLEQERLNSIATPFIMCNGIPNQKS